MEEIEKKIYIGTLVSTKTQEPQEMETAEGIITMPPMPQQPMDKVIFAENISEAEAIVGDDYKFDRLISIDMWEPMAGLDKAKGDFYMVDAKYWNSETKELNSAQTFLRAESFSEIEAIITEEGGEAFRSITSVEKSPYEVLGL